MEKCYEHWLFASLFDCHFSVLFLLIFIKYSFADLIYVHTEMLALNYIEDLVFKQTNKDFVYVDVNSLQ